MTNLCVWIITLFLLNSAHAQYTEYSLTAQSYDFTRTLSEWNPMNPNLTFPNTLGIGYTKQLTPFLAYFIPIQLGKVSYREDRLNPGIDKWIFDGDLTVQLEMFNHSRWLSPFLWSGIGGYYVYDAPSGEGFLAKIPVGVGLNAKLYNRIFIQFTTSYNRNITKNRGYFNYGLGLKYVFGQGIPKKIIPVPVHIASDEDADGIPDEDDRCPNIAGIAAFEGCPDSDGDLIPDYLDECPDVAGIEANNGCPLHTFKEDIVEGDTPLANNDKPLADNSEEMVVEDRDKDGIPDQLDECPDIFGIESNNGCPDTDTDGDGVPDARDRCPDIYGSVFANGCPEDSIIHEVDSNPLISANRQAKEEGGHAEPLGSQRQILDNHSEKLNPRNKDKILENEHAALDSSPENVVTERSTLTDTIPSSSGEVKKKKVPANKGIANIVRKEDPSLDSLASHRLGYQKRDTPRAPSAAEVSTKGRIPRGDHLKKPIHFDTLHQQVIIRDTIIKHIVVFDTIIRTFVKRDTNYIGYEKGKGQASVPPPSSNLKARTPPKDDAPTDSAPSSAEAKSVIKHKAVKSPVTTSQIDTKKVTQVSDHAQIMEELTLRFPYKIGALQPLHIRQLEGFVRSLRAHPEYMVSIEGGANDYSVSTVNRKLALKRAKAISKYLEIRHIDPSRIRIYSAVDSGISTSRTAQIRLMK